MSATHFVAALGAIAAVPLTSSWNLHTDATIDLTQSMHWPEPILTEIVENDAGPVMVTVEYHVDSEKRDAFLRAIKDLAYERKRDGSYAWGIFQDMADNGRFIETFFLSPGQSIYASTSASRKRIGCWKRTSANIPPSRRKPPITS